MTFYRYEDPVVFANGTIGEPILKGWAVVKTTPKGYVIRHLHKQRWMKRNARRPYAEATKELAAKAYLGRKYCHVEHCQRRLYLAKRFFEQAKNLAGEPDYPEPSYFINSGNFEDY